MALSYWLYRAARASKTNENTGAAGFFGRLLDYAEKERLQFGEAGMDLLGRSSVFFIHQNHIGLDAGSLRFRSIQS
jgi:hypothetical protein